MMCSKQSALTDVLYIFIVRSCVHARYISSKSWECKGEGGILKRQRNRICFDFVDLQRKRVHHSKHVQSGRSMIYSFRGSQRLSRELSG